MNHNDRSILFFRIVVVALSHESRTSFSSNDELKVFRKRKKKDALLVL